MFTKIRNTMLALAAIASLGVASLAVTTTSADARGFGGGGGFSRGGGGGGHVGMRMGGMRQMGGMRHVGIRHGGIRHVGIRHVGHRHIRIGHRHPNWCRWHGRCNVHVRWHRPWLYAAPVAAVATYAAAPAAAPRCTCLTKEYTQEGLTVFRDACTKEIASAPTGTTALPAAPDSTTMAPQSQTELQQPMQPQVR